MKRILRVIWTYIIAFTVNLKKTAEQVNRAESPEAFDRYLKNTFR